MSRPGERTHVEVRPAYADSVALLQVSRTAQALPGVLAAQVAMATTLNVEVLEQMRFAVPAGTSPNDMVVALRLTADADLDLVLHGVDEALASLRRSPARTAGGLAPHRTTATASRSADLGPVVVSVPGASAAVEAVDALEAGRDVMIFSDNVPLAQEVALKRVAAARGLLVMGPDCGTAVLDGLGLGFANVVTPGPVGIVAASGTGAQQLLTLLDHAGVGVSWVLGVGGRDLSEEVGGLATREALRRLDAEPGVSLVVLVSKPPAASVAADLTAYATALGTPVQLALLGPGRPDLTAAAEAVLHHLGRPVPPWPVHGSTRQRPAGASTVRGLYAGGTLAQEARLIVAAAGVAHEILDLGDDDLTQGRAHPMIDPTLRLERLRAVAADPATAVVLLDVALGHGAEMDPAALLAPAVAAIPAPVVVTVVGTAADPQGRDRQVASLVEAGAEVHVSNAGAARRAAEIAGGAAWRS